jgi:hypothetical protein
MVIALHGLDSLKDMRRRHNDVRKQRRHGGEKGGRRHVLTSGLGHQTLFCNRFVLLSGYK